MQDQALVDTLCASLLVVVPNTIGDILTYVEHEALVETLADTLADVGTQLGGDTLNGVEAGYAC